MKKSFLSLIIALIFTALCLVGCELLIPSEGFGNSVLVPCPGCGELISEDDAVGHEECGGCDGYMCDTAEHGLRQCGAHTVCDNGTLNHERCGSCDGYLCDGDNHNHENNGGSGDTVIGLDNIPAFSGDPYIEINGNKPFFGESEITDDSFESYSELDSLGRCGAAFSCIGIDLMPDEPREGSLSDPSGWNYNGKSNNNIYTIVSGGYVYNRCHLIGFQLTAENNNRLNLITGTKDLNIKGMLPFENMVADYIKETENHVMYRVTPIFEGNNLVASGVLMEAYSVEDDGEGICFCIYVYNVQPGIEINYLTGENRLESGDEGITDDGTVYTFILNTNKSSYKIHLESCSSASGWESKAHMIKFVGTLAELLEKYPDYTQCGNCRAIDECAGEDD